MTAMTEFRERTVGELAVEVPTSIRVFEAWKIDYCCGGKTPLPVACESVGKTVAEFVAALVQEPPVPNQVTRAWNVDSLTKIAANIVSTFHAYTREELQTIEPLAAKVLSVHGERRPELAEVSALVRELSDDMLPHMLKEEQVLFPYVSNLEDAAQRGVAAPTPFFGTVKNPVRKMMLEHDRVGEILAKLRQVTEGYTAPQSACFSYRELYRRLAELEGATHEHVHIENNLYFPRAVALEERAGKPAAFGDGCGSSCSH